MIRIQTSVMAILCAMMAIAPLTQAQELVVTPDHESGVYEIGQAVQWKVAYRIKPTTIPATQPAPAVPTGAKYSIKKGGMTVLREGSVDLVDGQATLDAKIEEPGSLLLEVNTTAGDKAIKGFGGAMAGLGKIEPSSPRPDDFDAFWAGKIDQLLKVPANPQLTPGESGKPNVEYAKITLDNIKGTHIQGQIAKPKDGKKLPALLIVQWAGVYPLQKGWVIDRAAEGWLALNINAHDLPIDQGPEFYKEQSNGPLKDYPNIGNDDRETSYFLRMYLSCYQAAEYLSRRDDWDGKILVVTGASQGGLQSIVTAAIHPKITALLADVPAGCDMTGPVVGRSPGWPKWYFAVGGKDAAKVREASRYYDVVNFASRVKCPALIGIGLVDQTCPPAGVYAAVNLLQGPHEAVLMPKGDHQKEHGPYYARFGPWLNDLRQGKDAPVKSAN